MKQRHILDKVVFFLLIVGGLNWGIFGLVNYNVIGGIFCMLPGVARLLYILVGLSAVYRLVIWIRAQCAK